MTQSPYGSDPSPEPASEPAQQPDEPRPTAAPTEQVPVQPAAGSEGFARPSGSWSSGSYGSTGPGADDGATTAFGAPTTSSPYGQVSAASSSYGSPYGDPYAGPPGVPTPPWGGQPAAWPDAPGRLAPGQHGPHGRPNGPYGAPSSSGFLSSLFDTSFDRFVTPLVAKVAYVVVILAVGLTWVANVVGALLTNPPYGLVVLVVGGVIALVTVIGARVLIEAVLALVRLADDTRLIRDKLGSDSPS